MTAPGSFTFWLAYPVEVDGTTITSLTLRPPGAGDVFACQKQFEDLSAQGPTVSASTALALALLARLEPRGAALIDQLEASDLMQAANAAVGEGGVFHADLARAMGLAGALHRTQPPRRGRRH